MPLPLFGPGPGDEAEEKRVPVVGVRFRPAGKIYYFDPGTLALEHDTHVVVDTVKGADFGIVTGKPFMLPACNMKQPLRRVLRIAEEADEKRRSDNLENEKSAFKICQEKIRQHGLDMKLTSAEYAFDGSKIMFYFTADGRIDFRDLVKDLAGVFHTRIELRQIGVRDETRSIGGYGVCGRPLCCASYLTDFIPVSIKMAKEQNLSLNPGKISGVCGRLMCCLKNEEETYEELNKPLPGIGDEVQGNDGLVGEVISVDVLRQRIRIIVEVNDEKEIHAYGVDEFTITRKRRRGQSRVSMSRGDQGHGSQGTARSGDAPEEGAGAGGRGRRPAHTGRRGQSGQDRNGAGMNSTQDSVQNSAQDGSQDRQGREERPNRRGDRPTDRPSDRSGERPGQGQQGQDGRGTRRGRRGGRDGAQRGGSPAGAGSPTAAVTENVQPADPSAGSVLPDVVTDSFDDGE
jgi:cell fate regulator YaaT (PSP1 superfamily)